MHDAAQADLIDRAGEMIDEIGGTERRSGGMMPAPGSASRHEAEIWTARVPLRMMLPVLVAAAAVACWPLYSYSGHIVQALVDATYPRWPWTEAGVLAAWGWAKILAFLPLAVLVPAAVRLKSRSWTLTTERLIYRHGILVRTADEIALHRVRDFRLIRPAMHILLGVGTVRVVSRDETWPVIDLGPLTAAAPRLEAIREAVLAHQRASGYREYEAH